MTPPIGGAIATGPSALDNNSLGLSTTSATRDTQRAQLEQIAGQLRDLDQQAQQLFQQIPAASQELQMIRAAIKQAVMKMAQAGPQQANSADQLPTGGA